MGSVSSPPVEIIQSSAESSTQLLTRRKVSNEDLRLSTILKKHKDENNPKLK